MGLLAAGTAAAICLIGAIGALIASDHFRGPTRPARTGLVDGGAAGLPLLLALVLRLQQGPIQGGRGITF